MESIFTNVQVQTSYVAITKKEAICFFETRKLLFFVQAVVAVVADVVVVVVILLVVVVLLCLDLSVFGVRTYFFQLSKNKKERKNFHTLVEKSFKAN